MQIYDVEIFWDDEADVWVATSDAIPIALENASYDTLIDRVRTAAPEILELNNKLHNSVQFRFKTERLIACG